MGAGGGRGGGGKPVAVGRGGTFGLVGGDAALVYVYSSPALIRAASYFARSCGSESISFADCIA